MGSSWIKSSIFKLRYIPIGLIRAYQILLSPFISQSCRFYPTCSMYARQAFQRYGVLKGLILTLFRISKCHPFHPGGYDPVD